MQKIIVIYYSRGGTTRRMAELVAEGARSHGVETDVRDVGSVEVDELLAYSGVIIGSPVYYGTMAAEIKKLVDESVKLHGRLDGRIGAAFASSGNLAGGNESTILDILHVLLVHGMIIHGDPKGDHYGPVAVGSCDERAADECLRLGGRVAELIKKLAAGPSA
ncbi:MAG: flavodoxin domain-containing protein [Candidatus Omnitrophota bacterium]|jgi:NAD(P)H dehydrogenase (quinone)